ncbi:hypothetical protein [Sporosarcina koreensis]|uniref:hypothetical protein n=1 Tax=Sporosarcina koreensis TaxID=334735 RepID=UPI0007552C16|nr:hypothetical protein [Sporosarcina koreensis]
MPLLSDESLRHFENAIYLPMLLTILARDREAVERSSFKFQAPYLRLIDAAIDAVQRDNKVTADYMRVNKLRLERGKVGDTFTSYIFYHGGYTDERRYLNVRLRNRAEELLELYLYEARRT